jgi:malonate transporter and related proteins
MEQMINVVLPVFGLIAIGYAVAGAKLLGADTGEALAGFVFAVAIPLLIFRTLATADFSGASPWLIWLPFFAVFAVNWVLGDFLIRRLFRRDARAGLVAGISSAYGNTVLLGIPLTLAAYGGDGAVPMALIVAVHLPVMMVVSAVLIERALRLDGIAEGHLDAKTRARNVLVSLAANPIIVGLFAGAVWRVLGLPLAGLPAVLVNRLADVASTVALFAMGMSLWRYGLRGNIRAGLLLSALKLLLQPALVLILVRTVAPMPASWARVAVLASACPTGVNAYLVAARFRTGEALASNAITLSTALAALTVSFWIQVVAWI